MRLYTVEDELRAGLDRCARDWTRAGLLSTGQSEDLRRDLAVDLRRTGLVLRLGLALFTVIAGAAAIGLVFLGINMNSEVAISIACALLGIGAFLGATMFARDLRWYRHGVEEALAVGAIGLFGFAVAVLGFRIFGGGMESEAVFAALAVTAASSLAVYRRFGYQYAAVGALCATALLSLPFGSLGEAAKRTFAALVCGGAFITVSRVLRRADNDVSQSDAEVLRAAAAAGAYLALNVEILSGPFGGHVAPWFRWGTWGVTWVLPLLFGRIALVGRDPRLLRVAMAAGLGSVLTYRAYLGWARQPWDPMILGLMLGGVAVVLKRWLASGPDGERRGFTSRPLVDTDTAAIQLVSLASVAAQPMPTRHPDVSADSSFAGGRSGGGGGGSEF